MRVFSLFWIPLLHVCCARKVREPLVIREVNSTELMDNAGFWTRDYVVMIDDGSRYKRSQWTTVWRAIAEHYWSSKNADRTVVFGTLACEGDAVDDEFCSALPVRYYPTFFVSGFGNFYDSRTSIKSFTTLPSGIPISSLLIRDWLGLMLSISSMQRKLAAVGRFFSFGRRSGVEKKQAKYVLELRQQRERTVRQRGHTEPAIATDYTASAAAPQKKPGKSTGTAAAPASKKGDFDVDAVLASGDAFALLHHLDWTDESAPFIMCVMDKASQYCAEPAHAGEAYCKMIDQCLLSGLEDPGCTPAKCPLQQKAGFEQVGACLTDPVLIEYEKRYKEKLAKTKAKLKL